MLGAPHASLHPCTTRGRWARLAQNRPRDLRQTGRQADRPGRHSADKRTDRPTRPTGQWGATVRLLSQCEKCMKMSVFCRQQNNKNKKKHTFRAPNGRTLHQTSGILKNKSKSVSVNDLLFADLKAPRWEKSSFLLTTLSVLCFLISLHL